MQNWNQNLTALNLPPPFASFAWGTLGTNQRFRWPAAELAWVFPSLCSRCRLSASYKEWQKYQSIVKDHCWNPLHGKNSHPIWHSAFLCQLEALAAPHTNCLVSYETLNICSLHFNTSECNLHHGPVSIDWYLGCHWCASTTCTVRNPLSFSGAIFMYIMAVFFCWNSHWAFRPIASEPPSQ